MEKKPRAAIYTLGCRTNQYESDAIAEKLESFGFEICPFSEKADVYIINTCSVTAEADRKSRQLIRRGRHKNENAVVIATGCYSQLNPDKASELGADFVCGSRNKLEAADYALCAVREKNIEKKISIPELDLMPIEEMSAAGNGKSRAYLKIEDGCDNKCAYCIIRQARGAVVSRNPDDIFEEAAEMVRSGCKEIVLTGTEIASYGRENGKYTLSDAISAVCESGAERVRIGSVEPSVLKPDFIGKLAGHKNFMPSFHLSLQSGSDSVLCAMRRKYNRSQVLSSVRLIRNTFPDAEFSADIIVGFPGESDEDFKDTCRVAEEIEFFHMHIFPYSDRKGTESEKMKNKIDAPVKNKRFDELSSLGESLAKKTHEKYISEKRVLSVLFEECDGEYYIGHAQNMLEVKVKTKRELAGKIAGCIPEKYIGGALECVLSEENK